MSLGSFLRSSPKSVGPTWVGAGLAVTALAGALLLRSRRVLADGPDAPLQRGPGPISRIDAPSGTPTSAEEPVEPARDPQEQIPDASEPTRTSVPIGRRSQGDASAPPNETVSRIDRLLATPLSKSERAELRLGPQIEVAPGFPAEHAERARAFVTAVLRATLAIRFDAPMPVTNATRMWDYLIAHIRRIEIYAPTTNGHINASADARTALVTVNGQGVAHWDPARWSTAFTPQGGLEAIGVGGIIPTLMHEARHLESGLGHRCNGDCTACGTDLYIRSNPLPGGSAVRDPSLAYGGADAVTFYTYLWLADHSGDWLSEVQRADERALSERLGGSMCDGRAPQMFRMPGEKA